MLPVQNGFARNQFSPSEKETQQISANEQHCHVIVVLEQVSTLRKHFAELAYKALTGPVQLLEAQESAEVLPLVAKRKPAMVVIDISASDYSGIATAAEIWKQDPGAKILFWCHSFKESYLQQLNQVVPPFAVYGIVLKSCIDEKMIHAIQSIMLHDNPFIDASIRSRVGASSQRNRLTRTEYETLCDVILGLTDKAIAKRRNLSARGVQNRLSALFSKLLSGRHAWLRESASMDVFNLRTRLVFEVVKSGLVDEESLEVLDQELDHWISTKFGL